jgi:hypothetical protein
MRRRRRLKYHLLGFLFVAISLTFPRPTSTSIPDVSKATAEDSNDIEAGSAATDREKGAEGKKEANRKRSEEVGRQAGRQ